MIDDLTFTSNVQSEPAVLTKDALEKAVEMVRNFDPSTLPARATARKRYLDYLTSVRFPKQLQEHVTAGYLAVLSPNSLISLKILSIS